MPQEPLPKREQSSPGGRGTLLLGILALLVCNSVLFHSVFSPPQLAVESLSSDTITPLLLHSPSGKLVLVDTGPDASILRELGTTLYPWQRTLSAIVITDPSASANGGLTSILSRYHVHEIIRSNTPGTAAFERSVASALLATQTPQIFVERGDRLLLGGGAYLDVLWPPQTHSTISVGDSSLVLKLGYGATSFLFENNLSARATAWMSTLNRGVTPPSIVLSSSTPRGIYTSDGREVRLK